MAMRSRVMAGYRSLLRTRLVVFKDDARAIRASKMKLKEEFMKNKNVTDAKKLASLLKGIEEVQQMLLHNVVQGKRNERGNYEVRLRPDTVSALGDESQKATLQAAHESARQASGQVEIDQCCTTKTGSPRE
eukprot:TRINITY_DN3183_c0_g1_i1.p1 TRINITY_DN3183_c0_g1~~TRINITY_DN3183_c0_g1_i1.p1  ORF type:complete len:132 (-),score=32.48 TRINITY_DN3183_c0_g1_i1:90-485(-)